MLTVSCSRLPLEPRRRVAIGRPRWITDLTARPLICVPRVRTKITHRIHGTQIKRHEKTRRPKACGYGKAARRRLLLTLCKRYYVIVLILLKKSNYVEFYVIRYCVLRVHKTQYLVTATWAAVCQKVRSSSPSQAMISFAGELARSVFSNAHSSELFAE